MDARTRRQVGTLKYFLPRPKERYGMVGQTLIDAIAESPRGVIESGPYTKAEWFNLLMDERLHQYYKDLGILSWTKLKDGKTQFILDVPRIKELVRDRVVAGIASGDERILGDIHEPSHECYALPLKKIFPEFRTIMKNFHREAWLAGYMAKSNEEEQ